MVEPSPLTVAILEMGLALSGKAAWLAAPSVLGIRSVTLADRGYRGVQPPEGVPLLNSHMRWLPKRLQTLLRRRQAIEPTIGHIKTDGFLSRNQRKCAEGDAIYAVLCVAMHNLSLIPAHLRVLLAALSGAILCEPYRSVGTLAAGRALLAYALGAQIGMLVAPSAPLVHRASV